MDKHACKLCFRKFSNGRALGGHMRSHVMANTKWVPPPPPPPESFSSSRNDDHDLDNKAAANYLLRENPKKNTRLADPESSYLVNVGNNYESDTESSRVPAINDSTNNNISTTHRRRSKRARRVLDPIISMEPDPVSSVSNNSAEEDVALSLMMLSRDKWQHIEADQYEYEHEDDIYEEDEADAEDFAPTRRPASKRSRYQCGTCKKVFKSYQALGGHRASHKKTNGCAPSARPVNEVRIHEEEEEEEEAVVQQHVCPFCFRVFSSGQALGGHKRTHMLAANHDIITNAAANDHDYVTIASDHTTAVAAAATDADVDAATKEKRINEFDLNMPAPFEEDAELSTISDS